MTTRRSFLSGLATLPLIGGSVQLVGHPTAAAVPVTDALVRSYKSWLFFEHRMLSFELAHYDHKRARDMQEVTWTKTPGDDWHFQWIGRGPAGWIDAPQPSTRAAVVLSAVGVPIGAEATSS